MRKFYLLILLIAFSCSHQNAERYVYAFSKNSSLQIVENEGTYIKWANIIEGQNLVFQYEYHAEDDERIADDEYSEFIRFEIDPALSQFEYRDNQLQDINLTLTQSCFCGFFDEEKDVPPLGTVTGTKISETQWLISIDVTFYREEHKSIRSNFFLQD